MAQVLDAVVDNSVKFTPRGTQIEVALEYRTVDDVPWAEAGAAKDWYARIKSRPSFRPLLKDHLLGMAPPAHTAPIALDAQEQALQLAANGHGLAMGRRPMVDDWLEQGRLIAPFGTADPTGAAFYLCKPRDLTPTAAARRAERWLTEAAEAWRGETGA